MIIIQLAGGLGNQMFQYALYLQLKSLGKEVKMDDVTAFVEDRQRTPALAPFGITYERATAKELTKMLDSSMLPWQRVRRKLWGRKKKAYFENNKRYQPEIMGWDDIYLEGYWQSEKYFAQAVQQVRESYDTDRLLEYLIKTEKDTEAARNRKCVAIRQDNITTVICGPENRSGGNLPVQDWLRQITETESVSLHIRGGDYLLPENQELFGGICTETYYRKAIELMRQEHPDAVFFLFTNDREWAKKKIDRICNEVRVVDTSGNNDNDYAEFALMSKCRHHILANSSFSWWASYLNPYEDKTVFAPDRWLNGWDCADFYRADMRRVSAAQDSADAVRT